MVCWLKEGGGGRREGRPFTTRCFIHYVSRLIISVFVKRSLRQLELELELESERGIVGAYLHAEAQGRIAKAFACDESEGWVRH